MTDHHNRHLEHFLRKSTLRLALMQTTQGNVGSLRSTALTLQALQDLNIVPSEVWDRTAAIKWILDRQRDDGSWSDEPLADGQDPNLGIGLTADIILALGRKGFGAVRMLQCNHILSEPTEYRHGKFFSSISLLSSNFISQNIFKHTMATEKKQSSSPKERDNPRSNATEKVSNGTQNHRHN